MNNNINKIKQLRLLTSASISDCKDAILYAKGNIEKAISSLKEKGILKISSSFSKKTAEGIIFLKKMFNKCIMIEIHCETDFVANSLHIKTLAEQIITTLFFCNIY